MHFDTFNCFKDNYAQSAIKDVEVCYGFERRSGFEELATSGTVRCWFLKRQPIRAQPVVTYRFKPFSSSLLIANIHSPVNEKLQLLINICRLFRELQTDELVPRKK